MRAQDCAGAAHHAGRVWRDLQGALEARLGRAAGAGEGFQAAPDPHHPALRVHLMARTIHVIGAGLSGLAAALRLSERGERVIVHEAMQQAGGRARSYYDASTDLVIDNGNHLLLSGNYAAMAYVRALGSEAGLGGPPQADFAFIDLPSNKRWTLRFNDGRLPWWMLDDRRRVPGSGLMDYVRLLPLVWASKGKTVGETIPCRGPVYDGLGHPLLLAALNTDPPQG